jgi:hypothetical protein
VAGILRTYSPSFNGMITQSQLRATSTNANTSTDDVINLPGVDLSKIIYRVVCDKSQLLRI